LSDYVAEGVGRVDNNLAFILFPDFDPAYLEFGFFMFGKGCGF
jgi:hypothetical protein